MCMCVLGVCLGVSVGSVNMNFKIFLTQLANNWGKMINEGEKGVYRTKKQLTKTFIRIPRGFEE